MRLFFIRHGETVDNIAQVYAGSRDSELTNHGFQQATRLGRHLYTSGHRFSHIFSSHLQRAYQTAELILQAQTSGLPTEQNAPCQVKRLPMLMEQDFGFYEGKKWYQKPPGVATSGKQAHRDENINEPGFVDMETKEAMAKRTDLFLDEHLIPFLDDQSAGHESAVAVVSHGIILSVLWRRLLLRLPPKSVTPSLQVLENARNFQLEHLGGWSNTGYLQLLMQKELDLPSSGASTEPTEKTGAEQAPLVASLDPPSHDGMEGDSPKGGELNLATKISKDITKSLSTPRTLNGWTTVIETVNGKQHLQGLRRTGNGVGSARHDAGQKTIDTFFKKRRIS